MAFYVQNMEPELESDDEDDGRLASLDALRFALSTAPFFRRVHNIQGLGAQPTDDYSAQPDSCAIHVRNVSFGYDHNQLVLNRMHLQVPKGRIYALLGSASCGKSTLLKCLIGRLRPTTGQIRVFATDPAISPVPGIGVGFMPQMMALYEELTIDETLQYYGALYRVPLAMIYQRVNFVLSLFNLPDEKRLIRHLSDNHRWRISLAVSLIHSPPLLLLDEPTVNVDPLIRLSIWDHLKSLCKEEGFVDKRPEVTGSNGITEPLILGLTVLITTHIAEEAEGAHTIGLMRNGRLMAEDMPHKLMVRFKTGTFDKLFLKLCQIDTQLKEKNTEFDDHWKTLPMAEWPLCERRLTQINSALINFNFMRFLASLKKNICVMRGSKILVLFFFLFPSLQMLFFCCSVGHQVRDIPVATFNAEKLGHWSRPLLRSLDNKVMKQLKYSSLESAVDAVVRGEVWAAIAVSDNFSDSIQLRFKCFESNFSSQDLSESNLKLFTDSSNAVISQTIIYSIIQTVTNFLPTISDQYLTRHSAPIQVKQIIYGSQSPTFTEFLAPGYVVAIIFIAPMLLTAYLLIKDQMNGLLERCLSTGTSGLEVMLSHFITQLKVLVIQELLVLTVTFVVFGIPVRGPVMALILIVYLQGVVGISFGLLISAICPNAISAILLTSGTVIPGVFLSGITWPIEAMPRPLRILSKGLPLTLPIESLRCIISRGVSGSHFKVLIGFAISTLYSLFNTFSAIFIFKWRTNS